MARVDAKESLLDAAVALHAREGPDGFTVHAVVAESGRSLGSLYHHFGSFDGLAAAAFARSLGALLDAVVAAVVPKRDPRRGVEALVRAYLAFTRDHRADALFLHAQSYAGFLPKHAAVIEAARAPRLAELFAWLAPHVTEKRVAKLPPPLFEVLVVGPVAETARRWLAGDLAIDLDEAARVLPARIWRSIAPDAGQ